MKMIASFFWRVRKFGVLVLEFGELVWSDLRKIVYKGKENGISSCRCQVLKVVAYSFSRKGL